MTVSGQWVKTFRDATHALPDGMHMNADYPFILPKIIANDGKFVTLKSDRGDETVRVRIQKSGDWDVCYIKQMSTFEKIYHRKPTRFKCYPFRNDR